MRKILILTGDGGESYEALYAVHRFREAGWQPVVAAPSARRLHLVMHDFEPGWDTYIERQGYGLDADISVSDATHEGYEAVLVLGGRAPEYLRNSSAVLDLVKSFDAAGKWIFAICHGIQVIAAAGLTQGKQVTCYEHCKLDAGGGTWNTSEAIRDGRIVTAQTWQSHPEFYREVFACLQ
jgi:protease I